MTNGQLVGRSFLYGDSPLISQYVFITNTKRLVLFIEVIAVICENHTKYIPTLCGQNAEVIMVKKDKYFRNSLRGS
jgi:hypothetical protein